MKILITGASGYIGTMLRRLHVDHEVTLLSREPIAPRDRERWFVSGDLQDPGWWNALSPDYRFDVVFHLAEALKEALSDRAGQQIVDGHVSFIRHFADNGAKVIYPLTAYLYDRRLSRANARYAEIKRGVHRRLKDNSKVSFPVIHPIVDSPHGLGKLIRIERRIPFFNIMCAFESAMPVLKLARLQEAFADPASIACGRIDIFSEMSSMKQLFRDDARSDVRPLSIAARNILLLLSFVPSFNLLVKGRNIDDPRF